MRRKFGRMRISWLMLLPLFLLACSCKQKTPVTKETWSFVVYGDTRVGVDIYSILAINMSKIVPVPKIAVCLGDVVQDPKVDTNWRNFWAASEPILQKMPLIIARGNHEGDDKAHDTILHMELRIPGDHFYYSKGVSDCYFIILDTEVRLQTQAILDGQLDWLENQLDSISSDNAYRNIFIFLHRPLYPQGPYKGQDLLNADQLHGLFLGHKKVKAVFAGHEHLYNRFMKDGLNYITTGGGGAPLYSGFGGDYHHFVKVTLYSDPEKINIRTIDTLSKVVENFDL